LSGIFEFSPTSTRLKRVTAFIGVGADGRLVDRQPCGEAVSDLVAELETEIGHVKVG
jgi:hypothetical protein